MSRIKKISTRFVNGLGFSNGCAEFVLNQPRYKQASILVAAKNFGCGSSREHAPWALADYGFKAVIAPTFADIFYNNCFKNGLLPVQLSEAEVDRLFEAASEIPGYELTIDLERQWVMDDWGNKFGFAIDPFRRDCLLKGLDDIGLTLQHEAAIAEYEARRVTFK